MPRVLLHDGWPVDEARLRAMVGDAQVDAWLAEGTLRYGELEPLPGAFWEPPAAAQGGVPFRPFPPGTDGRRS